MAAVCFSGAAITEQWIRHKLHITNPSLGTHREKIRHLGGALSNFIRLKSLDVSGNALFSVEGVEHLKKLERLILYNNCLPSVENLKGLRELTSLKELDVRLNPLTRRDPDYRPRLLRAILHLHTLDGSSVSNSERVSLDQDHRLSVVTLTDDDDVTLTSDLSDTSSAQKETDEEGSTDMIQHRRGTKKEKSRSSLWDPPSGKGTERPKVSFDEKTTAVCVKQPNRYEAHGHFTANPDQTHPCPSLINVRPHSPRGPGLNLPDPSNPVVHPPRLTYSSFNPTEGGTGPAPPTETRRKKEKSRSSLWDPPSGKGTERPKVSFDEKTTAVCVKQPNRYEAHGHFTANPDQTHPCPSLINVRPHSPRGPGLNLPDPSNPVVHPPRLTYSSFNPTEGGTGPEPPTETRRKSRYRKPLEKFLTLVDSDWTGGRSLHHSSSSFLSECVHILSLMETHVSSREAEVRTLRSQVNALRSEAVEREEANRAEVRTLRSQVNSLQSEAAEREEAHIAEVNALHLQLEETHGEARKVKDQLRVVLEENTELLQQLIVRLGPTVTH